MQMLWRMTDLLVLAAVVLELVVPRRTPRKMLKMMRVAGEFLAFLLGKIVADGGVPKLKQKENKMKTTTRKKDGQ